MKASIKVLPSTPSVAVFDTAFHSQIPKMHPPTQSLKSWPSNIKSDATGFTDWPTATWQKDTPRWHHGSCRNPSV
ncbi:MAG: hypothetical protein J4G01_09200 [Dehalococcoidia bacterium]|nr:hypothetical protein [Dehalococcoidia bacterium]